jgi:UDP-N-acetylmuramate--alanine ligase
VEVLLLCEVYPAGEKAIAAADGKALMQAIQMRGKVRPVFLESVAELPLVIRKTARSGDVVVTMGAGSIGAVPAMLMQRAALAANQN